MEKKLHKLHLHVLPFAADNRNPTAKMRSTINFDILQLLVIGRYCSPSNVRYSSTAFIATQRSSDCVVCVKWRIYSYAACYSLIT